MAGASGEARLAMERVPRGRGGEAGEHGDMLVVSLPLYCGIGGVAGVLGGATEHRVERRSRLRYNKCRLASFLGRIAAIN